MRGVIEHYMERTREYFQIETDYKICEKKIPTERTFMSRQSDGLLS
jgi:hypothetical protein